jgi:hypothetical protein
MSPLMDTFKFGYAVLEVQASIDEKLLKVKQGLRKYEVSVFDIEKFYFGAMPTGEFDELVIVTRNSEGKEKTYRFNSNSGEIGMVSLVEKLAELKPSADLRNLPREQALAQMKVIDSSKMALFSVPIIISTIVFLFLLPMLIHGLDNLNATVELNDLIQKNDLETRNLTIQGNMLSECLEEKTTKKGQSTTKFFCPLVADSWKSGEPIHVLAQIDDIPDNEFNSLFEKSEFQGVLRNVLWEGPSNSTKDFFIKEYGATMAPNVLEFEVNGDSKNDLYLFLLIFSIVEVLIGGIAIYLFKKSFS